MALKAKFVYFFINSAGALLLAVASALFLVVWTCPADCVPPHDPIFLMPLNDLFLIIGGITAVAALICLFSERLTTPALLLLWLAFTYLVFRADLFWIGCNSLNSFLGGFNYVFEVSSKTANVMVDIVFAYLLFGNCVTILLARRMPPPTEFLKMSCPACGSHIKFAIKNLGQRLDCPRCKAKITLRKPDEILKMSCFFCNEHVEFPAHALGRKLKCPHCNMEIGLKEEPICIQN